MPQAVQWNANRRRFMKAVLVQRFWLPFERACLLSPKPGRTSDTMALHGKALSCRVWFCTKACSQSRPIRIKTQPVS